MTPSPRPLALPVIIASVLCFGVISNSYGAVIVYEGFDYGAAPSLLGGLGNTTEIGLQGNWTSNGTVATATANYVPTGLTFSDLFVSGGLAQMNGLAASGDRTAAAWRQLNVDSQSGTLWGSYLFNRVSDVTTRSVASLLQGNANNITDNTGYFSLANNEFNQNVGGVRVSASVTGIGGAANAAAGGVIPALGTTYLYVFKLENIGEPSGSSQTATFWMLSAEQYDNFKLGGLDEAELNAAAMGSLATDVMERATFTTNGGLPTPGTFDSSDFIRLFNFAGAELITQFDEIKFSNSSINEAVIGIPEPSAMVGLAGALGMLLGVRRSRVRT
jgi:hypothetical protein